MRGTELLAFGTNSAYMLLSGDVEPQRLRHRAATNMQRVTPDVRAPCISWSSVYWRPPTLSDRQWRTRLGSSDVSAATDYGDVEIREDDLSSITEAELKKLRITRSELNRAFAEGVRLMKSRSDSVRPVAHKTFDGTWRVDLFRYSPTSDPLKQRKPGS